MVARWCVPEAEGKVAVDDESDDDEAGADGGEGRDVEVGIWGA